MDKKSISILDHTYKKIKNIDPNSKDDISIIQDAKKFIDEISDDLVKDITSFNFKFSMSSRVSAREFYNMISIILSWKLTGRYVTLPQLVISVYQIVNLSPNDIIKDVVNKYNELKQIS